MVGRQHNFFNPGYTPTEMEEIPAIYKKIIDGPASSLQNSFRNAKGKHSMGGSRGGGGAGGLDPPPPEKSQKYRVS